MEPNEKRFVPVKIRTKSYIKAYLISRFGHKPVMSQASHIGSKFYDLLSHRENDFEKILSSVLYNEEIKLFVSHYTFYTRGGFISNKKIKAFNLFMELEIKRSLRFYLDFYLSLTNSFEKSLPYAMERLGIEPEDWNEDSIKKDYYRYRIKAGSPMIYKKPGSQKL